MALGRVLQSIELGNGKILNHREGMPDIDIIIDSVKEDIERFKNELNSCNCTFDKKDKLHSDICAFEEVVDGWKKLKQGNTQIF